MKTEGEVPCCQPQGQLAQLPTQQLCGLGRNQWLHHPTAAAPSHLRKRLHLVSLCPKKEVNPVQSTVENTAE